MQFEYCVYCEDCKVFMDLGSYDYITGHFQGPFVVDENKLSDSDLALKSFLEQHSGHRVGLEFDFQRTWGWYQVSPKTSFCLVFDSDKPIMDYYAKEKPSLHGVLRDRWNELYNRLMRGFLIRPRKNRVNVLSIVDVYGWAWDIASYELFNSLPPRFHGTVVSRADFKRLDINPLDYDVVLCWVHSDIEILDQLSPDNTVLCISGWARLETPKTIEKHKEFNYFVACNNDLYETLEKHYPEKTIKSVSQGVDTKLFTPKPREEDGRFIVGWVGNVERPSKRFKIAHQAVSLVPGAELRVAGGVGTDFYHPHHKMAEFYQGLDCLLVTSELEVHPLIVYEAMSCGLPVVVMKVGDVDENVVCGYNGVSLPLNASLNRFVKSLELLKKSSMYRERLGRHARELILEKWSWEKVAPVYVELFDEVMS